MCQIFVVLLKEMERPQSNEVNLKMSRLAGKQIAGLRRAAYGKS